MSDKAWDILLVDDEVELLLVIGDLLQHHGYSVLTARDTGHALKQLDENKVRVVILDINLAGEDSIDFMPFIRLNYPDIPIILYTGLTHDDGQVKGMLAKGAACYVSKSQPTADLLYAVREVLGASGKSEEK